LPTSAPERRYRKQRESRRFPPMIHSLGMDLVPVDESSDDCFGELLK